LFSFSDVPGEVRGVANSGGAAVGTPLDTEEVGSAEELVRLEAPDDLDVAPDGLAVPGDQSIIIIKSVLI